MRLYELYQQKDYKYPSVIVDCNHANSGKQYLEQVRISKEVLHSCRHSGEVKSIVKGLMIESYLEDGCQKIGGRGCTANPSPDPLPWLGKDETADSGTRRFAVNGETSRRNLYFWGQTIIIEGSEKKGRILICR